jgi:transposase
MINEFYQHLNRIPPEEASSAVRQTFEIPLDIPDVSIEHVTTNRMGHIEITVKSTIEGTPCSQCGQITTKFYGEDREIRLRHLPILGRQTYICLRPKRYECPHCHGKPTTTQQLDWYTPRRSFTRAYEQQLLLSLVNSTVQDVSFKEAIGYEAIMGVIDRHMNRAINWEDITQLDVVGIDEISLKKGHRDFVAIITARVASETLILGVLPDRKKATVAAFLRDIPKRLRQTIHSVCSDMYDGFVNAAKEVLGRRVKVVIDRFHVAKLYRSGLDDLRKKELSRLKQELSEENYGQLKGAMWALRKSEANMNDQDQDVLICLFEHSPLLQTAYNLSSELTSIFDTHLSKRRGKNQLRKWMHKVRESELNCFDGFLTTLENHLDDIANYFVDRHTSGFVEGFNNKLKVIKRRCYGISNITHLFQRIQLDLYGYSLFALKS